MRNVHGNADETRAQAVEDHGADGEGGGHPTGCGASTRTVGGGHDCGCLLSLQGECLVVAMCFAVRVVDGFGACCDRREETQRLDSANWYSPKSVLRESFAGQVR